jgi:peptide/nickel transport system substrate-binding protein
MRNQIWKTVTAWLVLLAALLAVACGGAAATPAPVATTAPTTAQAPVLQQTATPIPNATPTPAATATPLPSGVTSARDDITLVLPEEPVALNSFGTIGASLNSSITRHNLQDPLTWQSGDDLRIVPTSATTGWEQIDADTWRFQLREGVKFHNGEPFNAQASLPTFASQGNPTSEGGSINYTGPYTAEAVDEFTVDLNCDQPCPIFPSTAFHVDFEAPQWVTTAPEEERARQSIGFGPYKFVEWSPGVSITMEAYQDYVPVGDHFEFQKPFIQDVTWFWRSEPTVIAAMVQAGEADMGWDIGVDSASSLPADMIRAGTSAETYALTMNTIWHPELKKLKVRQAMVHAINCQEMIDSLYQGFTTCRGNIIWPGIIGATERNTAPYEYDPDLSRQLLEEAGYNPENKITISSRAARVFKQVEISEALQSYWSDVGINAEIQIIEPSIRSERTQCGIGKATQEILTASGRNPEVDKPANADFQAALDKGTADCYYGDLMGNQPSNETLDFGRQMNYYMNCNSIRSLVCDPSPGGIQDQIAAALAASGEERQQKMEVLADRFHDDVMMITLFDLPVIYAVDPKLNWQPRLDPVVRVSAMWFSE